jgi:uncharacterized membrane protein YeaQ/YmgE (transglycosylase-associated protein family)
VSSGAVIAILISGLFTGGLARLALPGPDPMPLWLTIAIGLTGSIVGALVAEVISNGNGYVVSFVSLGVAIGLVAAYRHFVQKRPILGPGALKFPERGIGVEQTRERMLRAGIDPDALHPGATAPTDRPASARFAESTRLFGMLDELHRAELLTDEELIEKRAILAERPD